MSLIKNGVQVEAEDIDSGGSDDGHQLEPSKLVVGSTREPTLIEVMEDVDYILELSAENEHLLKYLTPARLL